MRRSPSTRTDAGGIAVGDDAAADAAIGAGGLDGHRQALSSTVAAWRTDSQTIAVLDLRRMRARAALVRRDRLAGRQVDDEVVQRTGDALVVHDALRQRPALVRAAVVEREHLVVAVRNTAMSPDGVRTTREPRRGMSFDRADFDPVAVMALMRPVRRQRRELVAVDAAPARSAHGSICEKRCE